MTSFLYILDPGSDKFVCPFCGEKRFVRFLNQSTGQYLPMEFGRCDREINCGYFRKPNSMLVPHEGQFHQSLEEVQSISFIAEEDMSLSLNDYDKNRLYQFLCTRIPENTVMDLMLEYAVGTSQHWSGATVFWQIDTDDRIRSGKIMQYDADTGRRIKEPGTRISWMHKILGLGDFRLDQCLFGEHLLKRYLYTMVGIVESEKTALVARAYFQGAEYIWLACGGLGNLSAAKCDVLRGRQVVLFPDVGGFEKWQAVKRKSSHMSGFQISDYLERNANAEERKQGYDLADYLLHYDYAAFQNCSKKSRWHKG